MCGHALHLHEPKGKGCRVISTLKPAAESFFFPDDAIVGRQVLCGCQTFVEDTNDEERNQ